MVLQEKIPTPAAEATASYDYSDLQEGTGVTIYNLAVAKHSGNTDYILKRSEIFAPDTEISGNASGTGMLADYDFDVQFNRPQNLKGTAYLNIPFFIRNNTGGQTSTVYLIGKLRRFDGTTETDLATTASASITSVGGSSDGSTVALLPLSITGVQHFKVGDKMRLTVEQWVTTHTGGTGIFVVGIDPQDLANDYIKNTSVTSKALSTSKASLHVPFVLKT